MEKINLLFNILISLFQNGMILFSLSFLFFFFLGFHLQLVPFSLTVFIFSIYNQHQEENYHGYSTYAN